MSQRTVVLVHGAWHAGSCWDELRTRLDAAGVANVAVDNPSVARAPSSLADDVANVRAAIDAVDGPVFLVGHSYGGAVITCAGAHEKVEALMYITAFALDAGESVLDNQLRGGEEMTLTDATTFEADVVLFDEARAEEFFYHDCSPELVAKACASLRPMSIAAFAGIPENISWRDKPASYVVCTEDRVLPVALQRSSADRVGTVMELPTGHSPFLSQPDDLAAVLIERSRA